MILGGEVPENGEIVIGLDENNQLQCIEKKAEMP